MSYQYKLKTFHFIIGQDHMLFRARNYENARKQLLSYMGKLQFGFAMEAQYLGYSYGVFGKIHRGEK